MHGSLVVCTDARPGANEPPHADEPRACPRCGAPVEALTVTRSEDFAGALEHAIKANKPFLIDVHVDANIRPPATGTWALPPIPHKVPVFGAPHVAAPVA